MRDAALAPVPGLLDLGREFKALASQYALTCQCLKTTHDVGERKQLEAQLRVLVCEARSVSVEHRAVSEHFLNLLYNGHDFPAASRFDRVEQLLR
jgi:hypothetical protein